MVPTYKSYTSKDIPSEIQEMALKNVKKWLWKVYHILTTGKAQTNLLKTPKEISKNRRLWK